VQLTRLQDQEGIYQHLGVVQGASSVIISESNVNNVGRDQINVYSGKH